MPDIVQHSERSVAIGLTTRWDFESDGFRAGLIPKAADTFREEGAAFDVLAGGMLAGKQIMERSRSLTNTNLVASRELNKVRKLLDAERNADEPEAEKIEDLRQRKSAFSKLQSDTQKSLNALTPDAMANRLMSHLMPDGQWLFTNGSGRACKLYIVPCPVFDREIGLRTIEALALKVGNDKIRVLSPGGDRLPLWENEKDSRLLEILTFEQAPWRSDYPATAPERRLRDKRTQSTSPQTPDLEVVGCAAVSILKPKGEAPIPYMAVQGLHRIENTRINENHTGVNVMIVDCDRVAPTMVSVSFKDMVSRERTFIGRPQDMTPEREKCINALRTHGRSTTGRIADETGLSREEVMKTLNGLLATPDHMTYKTWPGVVYFEEGDRWDFDLKWVQANLRYPSLPTDRMTDVIVSFACLHAGSCDTDYRHCLKVMPQVILEKRATILVGAGDFIEGTAHFMLQSGEIYAGINNTRMEELAGAMISQVIMEVFAARFDVMLEKAAKNPTVDLNVPAVLKGIILQALLQFIYIPGNHDLWNAKSANTPLDKMVSVITTQLSEGIEAILTAKNLQRPPELLDLVRTKVCTSKDERFDLPSGLRMAVMHPHMARAKNPSIRPWEMLQMAPECQVVIGGNFHVGITLETHGMQYGMRICVQNGTLKHGSPFERHKLKIVDQGFSFLQVESAQVQVDMTKPPMQRIVRTVSTFYTNDNPTSEDRQLDRDKPFRDLLAHIGVRNYMVN